MLGHGSSRSASGVVRATAINSRPAATASSRSPPASIQPMRSTGWSMGLVDWMSTRPVRPRESATCTFSSLIRCPPSTNPA